MSNHFAIRTSSVLVLLFILMIGSIVNAQPNSGGFLLRETTSGLEIALVNEAGEVTSVLQSLPDYSFASSENSLWVLHPDIWISTQREIAVSPDGTQLAFVAIQNQTQFQLIVYQQATATLIEEGLPGYARPIWSPDGRELLLEMVYVPDNATLPESSIYAPDSKTFRQLTNDAASRENNFQWLPDGNQIIYEKNRNIFLTDSFGATHQQLTQLEQQILPEITPSLCDTVWSPFAERIYFSVGCADDTEYLYSVDLNGNIRLDLSLIDLYSEGYLPFFVPMSIVDIYPSSINTDVFLLLEVTTANPNDASLDTTHAIHRLTSPETTQLVYEKSYSVNETVGITTSSMTPDQTYLAFAGGNEVTDNSYILNVVDLTNGNTILERIGAQGICDIDWLNTSVLIYEEIPRLNCFADRFATSINSIDIVTGVIMPVSSSRSVVGVPTYFPPLPISCDTSVVAQDINSMVSAINTGNNAGSLYTICLEDSTYTFSTADNSNPLGANALPVITGEIKILGNGAMITRDSSAPDFRFFRVADGATLTLENLTLNGRDPIDNAGTVRLQDVRLVGE